MPRSTLALFAMVVFALVVALAMPAGAEVLSGEFVGYPANGPAHFGDGTHDLIVDWSGAMYNLSGWFQGTDHVGLNSDGTIAYRLTNSDVYDAGVVDPLTVSDASAFDYSTTAITYYNDIVWGDGLVGFGVPEGHTVFFRGVNRDPGVWWDDPAFRDVNGYYGALVLHDFYMDPPCHSPVAGDPNTPFCYDNIESTAHLNATWYFQDDGTANFTPEPATGALVALGLVVMGSCRRLRRMSTEDPT